MSNKKQSFRYFRLAIAICWLTSVILFGLGMQWPVLFLPVHGKVVLRECYGFERTGLYLCMIAFGIGGAIRLFCWNKPKAAVFGGILAASGFVYFLVCLIRLILYLADKMERMEYSVNDALKLLEPGGWAVLSAVAIGLVWAILEFVVCLRKSRYSRSESLENTNTST